MATVVVGDDYYRDFPALSKFEKVVFTAVCTTQPEGQVQTIISERKHMICRTSFVAIRKVCQFWICIFVWASDWKMKVYIGYWYKCADLTIECSQTGYGQSSPYMDI